MVKVLSIADQELNDETKSDFDLWLTNHNLSQLQFAKMCEISSTAVLRIRNKTGVKIHPMIFLKVFLHTGIRSLCPAIIEMCPVDTKVVSRNQENYLSFLGEAIGKVATLSKLAEMIKRSDTMVGSLSNEERLIKNGYKMAFITTMREKIAAKFNELLLEKAQQDSQAIAQIEVILTGEETTEMREPSADLAEVQEPDEETDDIIDQIRKLVDDSGLNCRKCLTSQLANPQQIMQGEKGYMLQLGSKILEAYKHIKAINDLYQNGKLSKARRDQYRHLLTYPFVILFGEMQTLIDEVPEVFRAIVEGWKLGGLDDGGLAQDSYKGFCALFGEKPRKQNATKGGNGS